MFFLYPRLTWAACLAGSGPGVRAPKTCSDVAVVPQGTKARDGLELGPTPARLHTAELPGLTGQLRASEPPEGQRKEPRPSGSAGRRWPGEGGRRGTLPATCGRAWIVFLSLCLQRCRCSGFARLDTKYLGFGSRFFPCVCLITRLYCVQSATHAVSRLCTLGKGLSSLPWGISP